MKLYKAFINISIAILSLFLSLTMAAQEQKDSLVILMSSKSVQMVGEQDSGYRKVVGPARFLHNGTYLLCDTAIWTVDTRIIEAWGNVRILQEETVLDSDRLTYLIDSDLAQFRGSTVQLQDKDHNTLRTRHLDYNTKDSVAVFMNGGAMRDKDGQIVESDEGTYDSKIKTFTFSGNVNMFTDSVFVKTGYLKYESDKNLATFSSGTDAWKDQNMLSSQNGWYDRGREIFFFRNNVHVMSEDQEGWSDSLYFYRNTSDVEMRGKVQVSDTTRNVFALAGKIHYQDSLSKVTMTRKPAVITQTQEQNGAVDTVYLGAEMLVYQAIKMCDVDSAAIADSKARLAALDVDPVGNHRKKAAEEAAKRAEEEAKKDPNYRPDKNQKPDSADKKEQGRSVSDKSAPANSGATKNKSQKPVSGQSAPEKPISPMVKKSQADSLQTGLDSLSVRPDSLEIIDSLSLKDTLGIIDSLGMKDSLGVRDSMALKDSLGVRDSLGMKDSLAMAGDSLAVAADSIAVAEPKDTTKVGFLTALGKVKIFKKDMQVACDSLLYSDLDSLARLFKQPMIWHEKVRQYSADSITVVISQSKLTKASLMSNSFITIQEDTSHFDQIKGTEMIAYFDDQSNLERFDVLGGASAVFFLEEQEVLATVNKAESKMLSAAFKDGEIQTVHYYEEAKNDGYPVVQLKKDEQMLKGFKWDPDLRPADRKAVTPLSLRPSQRRMYASKPKARFIHTETYFPGYIGDIKRQIHVRDSLNRVRERERALESERAAAQKDTLSLTDSLSIRDSLSVRDSLSLRDSLSVRDSLALGDSLEVKDSLAIADSLGNRPLKPEDSFLSAKEKTAAARAAKREARIQKRDRKWAELDRKEAEKQKAKEEKKLKKLREKKRKALQEAAKQAEKDARTLEKYRKMYQKKLEKEQQRKNRRTKNIGGENGIVSLPRQGHPEQKDSRDMK